MQEPRLVRFTNHRSSDEKGYQVSLLIAFYNKWKDLRLVTASLEAQTFQDFELAICDDGSREEVVRTIHAWMEQTPMHVQHLWQEDRGFRKNRILNHGIVHSKAHYLIFVDGDCVLHPEFIREHFENRQVKTVLAGRRLELSPWITHQLTEERVKNGFLQRNLWWIIPSIASQRDNNGTRGIYVRNRWLRRILNQKERGIVGCNFSVHREDLIAVNGFDMRYEEPGTGEDSDIEYRLRLLGERIQPFCNIAVQYHLYHELLHRPNVNEELFLEVQRQVQAITPHGIKQL